MPSYVITGTSRGIGLEFVNQLSAHPENKVFALARNPDGSEGLQKIVKSHPNVIPIKADITMPEDWKAAVDAVSKTTGGTLDILVHNAVVVDAESSMAPLYGTAEQTKLMTSAITDAVNTNVNTMIEGTNAFLPLVLAGKEKKVIVISSAMALPDLVMQADVSGAVPYSAGKATLNLVVAKYAAELQPQGVKFLSISPGWVDTQKANPGSEQLQTFLLSKFRNIAPAITGPIQPDQSVRECLHTIATFDDKINGLMVSSMGNQQWLHV